MASQKDIRGRRTYHRLEASPIRLDPPTARKTPRRFWKVRPRRPRLRVFRRALAAPVRILARIRDAYVRMMVRFASSGALGGSSGYGFGGGYGSGFARPALKEYDEKVLVEIYKSLAAQSSQIVAPPRRQGQVSRYHSDTSIPENATV